MTDSHSHSTADAGSDSLLEFSESYGSDTGGVGAGDGARLVEHNGDRFEVPENLWDPDLNGGKGGVNAGAAAKMALDLRKQISDKAAGQSTVPEAYDLTVPDALSDMLEANTDHPLFAPVTEWAKEKGLSQTDFDELAGIFYTFEAAEMGRSDADQRGVLEEALGGESDRVLTDLSRWVEGLLGDEIQRNTAISETLGAIAGTAGGVLFLKALKDRIGTAGVPTGRSGGTRAPAVTRNSLQTLQNSAAYMDPGHPDHAETVRRVRDGFKSLYGE